MTLRNAIVAATLLAVPLGGWAAVDHVQDARYERRCVGSADDISLCYTGYAAKARRRCDAGIRPPGLPASARLKYCVQGWLAHEK